MQGGEITATNLSSSIPVLYITYNKIIKILKIVFWKQGTVAQQATLTRRMNNNDNPKITKQCNNR